TPKDVVVGSPPLAFTFGLGGLAVFPLRFGATATLIETATPPNLVKYIDAYRATIVFTAPTAYRVLLGALKDGADFSSLRLAVSAGETLPKPVYDDWIEKTGVEILDSMGSTEMIHVFITSRIGQSQGGVTGWPVTGYEARIVDDDMHDVPVNTPGRLAVRGPTGCRYLADERQTNYVRDGWNLTGDTFTCDENGLYRFVARADDMIISSGYNIGGPEVEAALLAHPAVAECGVVGAPDRERGEIVAAYVVLKDAGAATPQMASALQEHVKATLAPYKYPRAIHFVDALPKTSTGKIQRFVLRAEARKQET
ncbi:MAG: AMP-binding protein, partial [Rhodoblastus sp.]|nr:AMP-binding protein [Rhodoblastus sp.]